MTTFKGQVISTKNIQTATVSVKWRSRHALYGKSVTKTKKYHVHDPFSVQVNDQVEFIPCRPISKTKRWIITKVVGRDVTKSQPTKTSKTQRGEEAEKPKPKDQEIKKTKEHKNKRTKK